MAFLLVALYMNITALHDFTTSISHLASEFIWFLHERICPRSLKCRYIVYPCDLSFVSINFVPLCLQLLLLQGLGSSGAYFCRDKHIKFTIRLLLSNYSQPKCRHKGVRNLINVLLSFNHDACRSEVRIIFNMAFLTFVVCYEGAVSTEVAHLSALSTAGFSNLKAVSSWILLFEVLCFRINTSSGLCGICNFTTLR